MNAEVTQILHAYRDDPGELSRHLMPVVYDTLRRMAGRRMRNERHQLTLQPTALVHEAYLRLLGQGAHWENRRHFFGASAEAMRRILIEQARRRGRHKRRAPLVQVSLDELASDGRSVTDIVALIRALDRLKAAHPRKSRVVELRFLVGLSLQEVAQEVGISLATVKLDWQFARVWLFRELCGGARAGGADGGSFAR